MINKPIILASTSPRRKKLLQQVGLKFTVKSSHFKEDMSINLPPEQMVKYFAREKAKNVAVHYKQGIVIGADTVISLGNQILGKPHTAAVAKKTLRQISGRTIKIITGYSVVDCWTKKEVTKAITTKVKMKKLTTHEISNYIKTKEPLDKAGAFGIQGLGALLVSKIEGDYYNVVGLPLYDLVKTLKQFGIKII